MSYERFIAPILYIKYTTILSGRFVVKPVEERDGYTAGYLQQRFFAANFTRSPGNIRSGEEDAGELAKDPKFQEIKGRLLDKKTGLIDPDVLGEALGATGYPRQEK